MNNLTCFFCKNDCEKDSAAFFKCNACDVDFWISLTFSYFINLNFNNKRFCISYHSGDNFIDIKFFKKYLNFQNKESYRWITIKTLPYNVIRNKDANEIRNKIKKLLCLI